MLTNGKQVVTSVRHPMNDEDIARAVVDWLKFDTEVPHERLTVTVRNGWVTLEGEVRWERHRYAAERVVRSARGVKGLTSLITLRPTHSHS